MSKSLSALAFAIVASVFSVPAMAESGSSPDIIACSVSVQYSRSNNVTLNYVRDFEVTVTAPYSEDFSTATRLRFFDAVLSYDTGIPSVKILFDADVDVFNAVQFTETLDIHDLSKGNTLSGEHNFFSSVPGAAGRHRTKYSVTCAKA